MSWEGDIKNEVKGQDWVPKIIFDPDVVHGIKSSYDGIRIKLRQNFIVWLESENETIEKVQNEHY